MAGWEVCACAHFAAMPRPPFSWEKSKEYKEEGVWSSLFGTCSLDQEPWMFFVKADGNRVPPEEGAEAVVSAGEPLSLYQSLGL